MATHMIWVRIRPEAPTRAPLMISTLLLSTKPVMAAARPDRELRNEMMTGMSAPPMGMTNKTPSARLMAVNRAAGANSYRVRQAKKVMYTPSTGAAENQGDVDHMATRDQGRLPAILPLSLRKATRLPVIVTLPIRIERAALIEASAPMREAAVPRFALLMISVHKMDSATRPRRHRRSR